MNKLWSHIAVLFAGISAGIFVAVKWLQVDRVAVYVRKVKQKRTSGQTTTTIPINIDTPKMARKTKREDKKQARIIRRNQKKAEKAVNRLEY
ncbi:MAG TPA: hypothetical protein ENH82_15220 [bacterium]|nr:hypothetical protein [bacterium]